MFLKQFVERLERRDLSEATVSAYHSDLVLFERWFRLSGAELPISVTPLDVRDYREFLQAEGMRPATVNRKLTSLRVYFDWAVEENLTPVSPMEGIRLVQEIETGPRWLTRTEQRNLIRAVQREMYAGKSLRRERAVRDNAIILLMLHGGLRTAEIARAQRGDLMLSDRSGSLVVRGKGNKTRIVPLNRTVRKALIGWMNYWHRAPEDFIFCSQKGKGTAMSRSTVWRIVLKFASRAGIEDMSAHSLRHTCAKNLIDRGVSLDQVAGILGHSDVNTTRIYTMPSQADLARAVERTAWED